MTDGLRKEGLGASADAETGSRPTDGAAEASPPSGFDPARYYPCPFDVRLARTPYLVLPKLAIQVMPWEWRVRFDAMLQEMEDAGIETPTYEVVRAGGEIRQKMCRDKDSWQCGERVPVPSIRDEWADYRHNQIAKVAALCPAFASGMETRSAIDPKGRGPKGDSPTAESGDAQKESPND